MEIRARAAQDFNGIPVITNRTIEETVRLKEGETTVIGGIVQRDEALTLSGTPGLSQLLIPGRLVTKRNKDAGETELLLFITPRRLRLTPRPSRSLLAAPVKGAARSGSNP